MVKLTEVEDEHFTATQAGPRGAGGPKNSKTVIEEEDDDDYFTDTDSSLSSTSSTTHHHHHGPTPSGSTSRNHKRPTRAVDDEDDEDDDDDDDDSNPLNESLADRVSALKDMIPPRQRARLSTGVTTSARWMRAGFQLGGKTLWVVSTSMLLVVVPWTLACVEEAQMVEMEREMKMQQSANEVLTPGATSLVGQHLGQGAPVAVTGSGL